MAPSADFRKKIGLARFHILTGATGLRFADAFAHALALEIEGLPIHILSIKDLIKSKRACVRAKDAADVETLESLGRSAASPANDDQ